MKLEWIGWIATAVFASSYLWKRPAVLRRVQEVVVANVVVAAMDMLSSARNSYKTRPG